MEDFDLDVARATVLEARGRNGEAAELHLTEGRTVEAITLFIKDPHNRELMRRGSQCLLKGLWQNLSFAVLPNTSAPNPILPRLLALAKEVNTELLDNDGRNEVRVFPIVRVVSSSNMTRSLCFCVLRQATIQNCLKLPSSSGLGSKINTTVTSALCYCVLIISSALHQKYRRRG